MSWIRNNRGFRIKKLSQSVRFTGGRGRSQSSITVLELLEETEVIGN